MVLLSLYSFSQIILSKMLICHTNAYVWNPHPQVVSLGNGTGTVIPGFCRKIYKPSEC